MSRRTALFLSFSILLLSCAKVQAALIAYEPFDDSTPNRVLGQANTSTGTSWLLAAASASGGDTTGINVASGSLSVPSVMPTPIGNSASVNGNGNSSGAADRLAFASSGGSIAAGSVF